MDDNSYTKVLLSSDDSNSGQDSIIDSSQIFDLAGLVKAMIKRIQTLKEEAARMAFDHKILLSKHRKLRQFHEELIVNYELLKTERASCAEKLNEFHDTQKRLNEEAVSLKKETTKLSKENSELRKQISTIEIKLQVLSEMIASTSLTKQHDE